MGAMQETRASRKRDGATPVRRISLDKVETQDALDRKMLEAIERIERLQSRTLLAVGSILATG